MLGVKAEDDSEKDTKSMAHCSSCTRHGEQLAWVHGLPLGRLYFDPEANMTGHFQRCGRDQKHNIHSKHGIACPKA